MTTALCTLQGSPVWQDDPLEGERFGLVHLLADADVDADGANGQTVIDGVRQFAYAPDDKGLDYLANACYPHGDYRSILVCDGGQPITVNGGFISSTAYFRAGKAWNDPDRYLDAASVPYMVIEGWIRKRCQGIALGGKGRITNMITGQWTWAAVGDIGPLKKIGEMSIAAAKAVGIPPSPRDGGTPKNIIKYEFWPGVPAVLPSGETLDLIAA